MFKPSRKPFLNVFSKSKQSPPIWFMRQAGRYLPEYRELRKDFPDFIKFCLSPKATLEAALQPLRRFPLDVAILFSDILILPFALGQEVTFKEKTGPALSPFAWKDLSNSYDLSQILRNLEPVFESLSLLKSSLPDTVTCLGFVGGPFTVAAYMIENALTRDLHTVKSIAFEDPVRFQRFLETLAYITAQYALTQIEAGAEALQIFDSWAGHIPESRMKDWFYTPLKIIRDAIREKYPAVPVLGYARGIGAYGEDLITKTGLDAFSFDQSFLLEKVSDFSAVFQGNLDPTLLIKPSHFLLKEAERLLQTFESKPYIFNVSQGLFPQTDPDLVSSLVGFVRSQRTEIV
ncbi:MAG: uroporphyrinogen decarboxylase [Alphaproteobacteria bacterium 16-39-46]|nr:MAG: uroporphyrinogen decarboxylase [Alphaproteobacteria bacterium 16-39-46]OZA42476.1 MAG: uroporphyrinogen decarboxylase [Alphaproteobacteria bacterium 17-39-52]HQS84433.1 uroporphyrinogen decarboxylase [Alphaproteobacteria bacterium]HQS94389.1 uroporphyrinogen decarboxylase [Alphaproteobacteria bacterium]